MYVLIGIISFFVVFALISLCFNKLNWGRVDLTRDNVIEVLQSLLDGREHPHAWDDFISVPIKDPKLDKIRERLANTDDGEEYPPKTERGRKVIQELLAELRSSNS